MEEDYIGEQSGRGDRYGKNSNEMSLKNNSIDLTATKYVSNRAHLY